MSGPSSRTAVIGLAVAFALIVVFGVSSVVLSLALARGIGPMVVVIGTIVAASAAIGFLARSLGRR